MLEKAFLKSWRPYCWLVVLGAAVYFQALSFDYTKLDDFHLIVLDQQYIGDLRNIPTAFMTDVFWKSPGAYYRPLLNVSLMLDAAWGGIEPFAFHLTNVLLHLASAIMVFVLLGAFGYQRKLRLPFAAAFAVHPALAQAVSWVPGRNDTLLTLFALIAVWSLLKVSETRRWQWFLAHIISLTAAFLTKETALIMPAICLIYLALFGRGKVPLKLVLWLAAGWVLTVTGYLLLRSRAIRPDLSNVAFNTFGENIAGVVSYIGKTVIPVHLSVLPVGRDLTIVPGLAAIAGLGALWLIAGVGDRKRFWFGSAWFLLLLLPTVVRSQDFAVFMEQRLYLPLFGLMLMLLESNLWRHDKAPLAIVAVIGLFSLQTIRYNATFASSLSFWENAAATSPTSSFAHRMLAKARSEQGEDEAAKEEYRQALSLDPDDIYSYSELGQLYYKAGDLREAEHQLRTAVAINPNHAGIQYNLGYFYLLTGRRPLAQQAFLRGLAIDPANAELHFIMARLYVDQQRYDSAACHYDIALRRGHQPNPTLEAILGSYRTGRDR